MRYKRSFNLKKRKEIKKEKRKKADFINCDKIKIRNIFKEI